MATDQDLDTVDRRVFLGATDKRSRLAQHGGCATTAVGRPASAAQSEPVSEIIADFIAGFDLKRVPPVAIERARTAFVDTVGVMLAGSQLPPANIVGEVVRLTASAPAATIGSPLRAAPQLAALANGVAGHDMEFDSPISPARPSPVSSPPFCRSRRRAAQHPQTHWPRSSSPPKSPDALHAQRRWRCARQAGIRPAPSA